MFHKKNKSHSLAFNAGPPRVVANRPALLAGRCGKLPAPSFRTVRHSRIILQKNFAAFAALREINHSGKSSTLMLKTIAVSPALSQMQVEHFCVKNIPALQGKELFRIVPQKKQIPLVSLQRRFSTCRCEPSRAFGGTVWQPPRPFIQELPQSSPELQNHYKNFAAFA